MCTSATDERRSAFIYLIVTAATALFGGVYEAFSHGVWSPFMVYSFAFPLILGAIPSAYRVMRGMRKPSRWTRRLQAAAIAALTVGSIMQGVMDIYGTTSRLIRVYWVVGAVMLAAAFLLALKRTDSPHA